MIAFIDGKIEEIKSDYLVIATAGIGYFIRTAANVYGRISEGDECRIYTHQAVREDDISLYGFLDKADKELFQLLIQVSGIGPKSAINIVGYAPMEQIYQAVLEEDMAFLTQLPSIGKKTAQRIILDMKDKLKDLNIESNITGSVGLTRLTGGQKGSTATATDATEALAALGYTSREIDKALADLKKKYSDEERLAWSVDSYIKNALQSLMQAK